MLKAGCEFLVLLGNFVLHHANPIAKSLNLLSYHIEFLTFGVFLEIIKVELIFIAQEYSTEKLHLFDALLTDQQPDLCEFAGLAENVLCDSVSNLHHIVYQQQ